MISQDKLISCGGYDVKYFDASSDCDLYDFTTNEWNKINSMNKARFRCGIYFENELNKRVYVIGGKDGYYKSSKNCEYYDIIKNTWITFSDTNECHRHPVIWMEDINTLNIVSSWSGVFEKMDLRENKWNITIGNDAFDALFGISIPTQSDKYRIIM